MKIIALTAENVKKLTAVEIKPDGNLVQITGKNGAGKTSVLDAIWWALAGATHIQAVPIRKGATEARIRLDLGELIVTRKFTKADDGQFTTSIRVENAEGFRPPSPQRVLDGLLGALSFDPLAFTRMEPRAQFDALRRFVPGVDFAAIEAANKSDFQRRTDINRDAKAARIAAEQIVVPEGLPDGEIDETALVAELEQAGRHNASIETRKANRVAAAEKIEENERRAAAISDTAREVQGATRTRQADRLHELRDEIARIEAEIVRVNDAANAEFKKIAADAGDARTALEQESKAIQAKLDAAGELPDPIDSGALSASIVAARATNAGIAQRQQRAAHSARAQELEGASKDLTNAMEAREKAKLAAIGAAKMPVPGIGFGDGAVTLNGLPFDQASDAEQLRASIAIAMASNSKLRVCRVRDGSLLDEDGLKLLAEMADEADCQVWLERVDSSGRVGFVLEDGSIRQPDLMAAE